MERSVDKPREMVWIVAKATEVASSKNAQHDVAGSNSIKRVIVSPAHSGR